MSLLYGDEGESARGFWRGLEDYVPDGDSESVDHEGTIVTNYIGRGVLTGVNHDTPPCSIWIKIDGNTVINTTMPQTNLMFLGFEISLWVRMVSGGEGGKGSVFYLHE